MKLFHLNVKINTFSLNDIVELNNPKNQTEQYKINISNQSYTTILV